MKCDRCQQDFPEHLIEESHDVPCYLFEGYNRKEKKNKADKFGRHWLCGCCHKKYEAGLRIKLKLEARKFAAVVFKGEVL